MAQFGEKYLKTVLEINKHFEGYVDSYFGPQPIKEEVETSGKRTILDLREDVKELASLIPEDGKRGKYLEKNIQAMYFTLRMLDGEKFDFYEEIKGIYDIKPRLMSEDKILRVRRTLEEILSASNESKISPSNDDHDKDLYGLYMDWVEKFRLNKRELIKSFNFTLKEVKKRTSEFIPLIEGEKVEVTYVKDQPWKAYNYFLGNAHSKIDVNLDYHYYAFEIPHVLAHETYPGHHLLLQIREKNLYQEKGYLEAAVCTLQSPLVVIAEGTANLAAEIIFSHDELYPWITDTLLPKLNRTLNPDEKEEFYQVLETVDQLQMPGMSFNIITNTALQYHTGKINKEMAINYLREYGLVSPKTSSSIVEMMMMPLYRSYMTIYSEGYHLVKDYVKKGNKTKRFINLLTKNSLPSWL